MRTLLAYIPRISLQSEMIRQSQVILAFHVIPPLTIEDLNKSCFVLYGRIVIEQRIVNILQNIATLLVVHCSTYCNTIGGFFPNNKLQCIVEEQ
jgi:hypothetical protein